MTTDQPASGLVVRVLDAARHTVGVGVLVGPREVLTCAHVVNAALGRDRRAQDQPEGEVTVQFAAGDGPLLRARVQRWLPPPRTGAAGDDIAGLVLPSTELPAGATPARLATNLPGRGRMVDVFGYPGNPPRPRGAWVEAAIRGLVGGGHLQLDATTETALRIQPGFSGSPVYDRTTGRVVGLLATAPATTSGERDSYAIAADRLRLAWPEVLDSRHAQVRDRGTRELNELTILHVSDPQFGRNHLFGGNGLTPADQTYDTMFRRLHDDLDRLAGEHGLRPDLMVVTGDLAEWGLRSEFQQVGEFLAALAEGVELPRRHVVIVPGNHDVNRSACQAYFLRQRADEREPVPPYWPKWEHFAAAFEEFYDGVDGVSFTPDEPWTMFEIPDLAVVVAGLNSTMAESHQDVHHYGWVGEHQLRWFAERLARYQDQGWLRIAAVHHNAVRGAVADDENLRDADDLDRWLGQPRLVNLLLHGHTHDGRLHRLSSGLLALSTGSAAVAASARPQEVPNQYQLLTVRSSGVERHARQYSVGQRRWIGDTRVSPNGSDWRHDEPHQLHHVHATFASDQPDIAVSRRTGPRRDGATSGDGFFDRVLEATRASHPGARVTSRPEANYLRVSRPLPDGGAEQWPVGVVDGEITSAELAAFVQRVHLRFASADPSVRSELVHSGRPASDALVTEARYCGVRLRSFMNYQGLVDLRPLVERQAERLANDLIYPSQLYVPQRYRLLEYEPSVEAHHNLLGRVIEWLGADSARFVMVLGDFGRGKTFLLRELTRTLPQHLPGIMPVLVELRSLEKAPSLDELLAQHLVRQDVDAFDVTKLRYMIRTGRVALLFDGFDELELRIGFDNATDYLNTLLRAVTDNAKVVLTSRTQHFRSTAQIRTALGAQVAAIAASRAAVLEDFTEEQILQFLTQHYDGNKNSARTRFALLGDVHDLLGLSRNPRMLSFIAELDDQRLRAVQKKHGQISAAELYRELVNLWLLREAKRYQHRGGLPSLDEQERLEACTALALRLWETTALTIPEAELTTEVSGTLTQLTERGYSPDQAAHTVGSGTLLARTPEGEFAFVHQSVMEWLVANSAAEKLKHSDVAPTLLTRPMSALMLDFLCDLAGHEVALRWAAAILADPTAPEVAKQNALAVSQRLDPRARQVLAGVDLRGQDFTDRDLENTNMQGADLRGMRLVGTNLAGADLRRADLTGIRMVGGDLSGAQLTGSRWKRAALLGVSGINEVIGAPELGAAAIAGRALADAVIAITGVVNCTAFSTDSTLIAVARGLSVEIVEVASRQTLRVLSGHTGEVLGVAFSPDGTLLATASEDRTARLWDPATGQHRTTLQGHTGPVLGVAFSPDGALLATASEDWTARLWDPATGRHRTTLPAHTGPVLGVAFSRNGAVLATASDDSTTRLWDPATGQHRTTLEGHTGPVLGVAFSPDNTLLATGSDDRTARLWDPATGQHRTTLPAHTASVVGVAFSPNGAVLATASDDRTARLWDPATGQHHTTLEGHTGPVLGVAFSPDNALLATASEDRTARLWDPATGQHHTTLEEHTDRWHRLTAVAFSPDGELLATASEDRTARLWDPATGQLFTTLEGHTGALLGVAFSPNGALIATTSTDGTTRLWNPFTGQHLTTLQGHTGPVLGAAFSPHGALLATTSADRTTRLWNSTTGQPHATLEGPLDQRGRLTAVAFSPDGALLATSSDDGTTRLWGTPGGLRRYLPRRYRATMRGHRGPVNAVAFSPNGALLATTSDDGTTRLWNPSAGQLRTILQGHTGAVLGVAFSPDGTLLATTSDDGTTRLWNPFTGQHLTTLQGHTNSLNAVKFSPDGTLVATTSDDGTSRLWDPAAGTCLATLLPLEQRGYAVLLPDGSYKLQGDPGRFFWWAIKLCRFAPGELDQYDPTIRRLPADAPIPR